MYLKCSIFTDIIFPFPFNDLASLFLLDALVISVSPLRGSTAFQLDWHCNIQIMEKSMVQELSVLTHSTIFSSRPSFLSVDPDRPELRRSRIQNLPGYRKEDLSTRLNFVVVFQTIEIERLTQEVETLRIMVRDAERQRLNFENYEVQIRELTERCHAFELHREDLQEELERMKSFCGRLVEQLEEQSASREEGLREKYQMEKGRAEQLQGEVDRWRNRYAGLQLARAKELEQVRQEFESRRRSQISRETRELAIKHENEVASLASDLRKAREEAHLRAGEIARLEELMGKFQLRQQEMREVEDKMQDYENRFVLLSQENYRLNELLRKRSEDLDRTRRESNDFKVRAESRVSLEQELRRLQTTIQEKQVSIDQLQRSLRSYMEEKERMGLQCQKGQNYERLVDELEAELQRMNGVLREKVNEGDQFRTNQRILEGKLAAATAATQKEFATYEERIITYTRDQERLTAQLRHRVAENEQLKVRCGELERISSGNDALRQQNENLRGQLGQYNNKMEEFKRKIKLHEENLTLMEEIEKKLRNEEQVKRQLMLDREKLNANIRELTLRAETSTQRAQAAMESLGQLSGLEKEVSQCKERMAWMTQELDRVSNELQLRVGELHQLRENCRTLGSSKTSYQGIEQRLIQNLAQMEQLVLDLDHSRRENDRLHNDNMNMEVTIRGLQGQIITLHDERDDHKRLFNAQAVEVQELRQKVEHYAGEGKVRQQLEQVVQEQQKKLENYKTMYAQMEERLTKETAQSETMVYELMQMRSQPRVSRELADELIVVRRQAQEQRAVMGVLFQRIEAIQNILRAVREGYRREMEELASMKQRMGQLVASAGCIDDFHLLITSYVERIDTLREENFKLESEKALTGVEYCESFKVLQEAPVPAPQPSIKNSSIAFNVISQEVREEENSNYLFTFKQVHRQQSLQQQDQIHERTETEQNETTHSPEEGSMASSFINTLITKESSARFDLRPIDAENSAFGYNVNSKLRYLAPSERFHQDYSPIEREIENLPAQINRAISPTHQRGAVFENAGIKRVVSYTHFAPSLIQGPPGSPSYPSWQRRDSPSGLRAPASPNTVNSTNELSSHLGKRIRITADPARLLLYRQQH